MVMLGGMKIKEEIMIDLDKLISLVLDLKLEESKDNYDVEKCKELEQEILTYLKNNI